MLSVIDSNEEWWQLFVRDATREVTQMEGVGRRFQCRTWWQVDLQLCSHEKLGVLYTEGTLTYAHFMIIDINLGRFKNIVVDM